MTSYLPPGDDVSKIFMVLRDFVQSTSMPSLVLIGPQIKEKQGGGGHIVPRSLNRVNAFIIRIF